MLQEQKLHIFLSVAGILAKVAAPSSARLSWKMRVRIAVQNNVM